MRISKPQILSRSKQNLRIEFAAQDLSSYGGLELIRRYFQLIGLHRRVHAAFARYHIGGDYRPIDMILTIICLLLTGGNRLDHLAHLCADPLVKRFCGLLKMPHERSVSRWLKRFTIQSLQALVEINSDIVCEAIRDNDLTRLTIDVDGSVLTTGSSVAWAFRGYNRQRRGRPSYYPITAHLAQTGHILRTQNRPGNVHDSKGAAAFIRSLIDDLRARLPGHLPLEFRMDAAFFQKAIIDLLEHRGTSYAIKAPMTPWTGIADIIRARRRWRRLDATFSWFEIALPITSWDRTLRVLVYRKLVKKSHHQLDLFEPDNGRFEYSAIATNKDFSPKMLLDFMAGRGAHEKTYAELKGEWAFDSIPTNHYTANSAWMQTSALGYNLLRSFQLRTTAESKPRTWKRTFLWALASLRTVRFTLLCQPARLVRPQGYDVLKFSVAPESQKLISAVEQQLAEAA